MADQLFDRAEADLTVRIAGQTDPIIWEHSARVMRLAELICALPEVPSSSIDRLALRAAALYHDAGWVLQVQSGEVRPTDLLLRPTSDLQRDLGADWMMLRLDGLVGPGILQLAARAIRQCNDRRTDLPEAQILAEAENLDEIGPTNICTMLRKKLAEGRTLADVVAGWERQEEYHYWEARLKDSFRYPGVRRIAERRLGALRHFMIALRASVRCDDIASPGPPGPSPAPTPRAAVT